MHRKREEAAQVALKIACRIPAKCQQVFVESPDFAPAESLPNFCAKRNCNTAIITSSVMLSGRKSPISLSLSPPSGFLRLGPRERGTPNVEKSSFFSAPPG